jgi:hypothetical protein
MCWSPFEPCLRLFLHWVQQLLLLGSTCIPRTFLLFFHSNTDMTDVNGDKRKWNSPGTMCSPCAQLDLHVLCFNRLTVIEFRYDTKHILYLALWRFVTLKSRLNQKPGYCVMYP